VGYEPEHLQMIEATSRKKRYVMWCAHISSLQSMATHNDKMIGVTDSKQLGDVV
jgi:hypothetical protein